MATKVWICSDSHRLEAQKGDPAKLDKGPPCRKNLGNEKPCSKPTKGKWIGRFGDQIKRFDTQSVALAWEDSQGEEKKLVPAMEGGETLLDWDAAEKIFEEFLDGKIIKGRSLATTTRKTYKKYVGTIKRAFHAMYLQEMTDKVVEAFIKGEYADRSTSTKDGIIITVKHMFKALCQSLEFAEYPRLHGAKVKIDKVPLRGNHTENETFLETPEEWVMLLEECRSPHLYHFVFGIMHTGLRNSDMLKLKLSEIDFSKNLIRTIVKGSKKVEIPLHPRYKDYLLNVWLPERAKVPHALNNEYLILGYRPGPRGPAVARPFFNSGSKIGFKSACQRCAARFAEMGNFAAADRLRMLTPHMLRHTFATHFIYNNIQKDGADGVTLKLSRILGHSTTYITHRYIHILKPQQHEAMANYGDAILAPDFLVKTVFGGKGSIGKRPAGSYVRKAPYGKRGPYAKRKQVQVEPSEISDTVSILVKTQPVEKIGDFS